MNINLAQYLPWLILLAVGFYLVAIYNGLVALRNRFKNAFAQIDVQLQRRYDLIPNLVETAKGYLSHERQTLEAVIAARNTALAASREARQKPGDGGMLNALAGAEGLLAGALANLNVVMEAYPDLKADQAMLQVQEELSSTENRIAFARQAYNDSVMHYNTKRESFPDNLIAGFFQFQEAASWEMADPTQRENVKVSFS
ncbi:MAG: LemA family protein [Magnetococcales bacterium]|nr:LemA family protein [Magnetococcales bacterium]